MSDTSWRKTGTRHLGRSGSVSDRRYERVVVGSSTAEVYPEETMLLKLTFRSAPNIGLELVDVSESGMRVTLSRNVGIDSVVRVVGRIPHFAETLEGKARVVWCAESSTPEVFVAGLDFTQVPNGHYDKIQRLRRAVLSPEFRQMLTTLKNEKTAAAEGAKRRDDGEGNLVIMPPPNT